MIYKKIIYSLLFIFSLVGIISINVNANSWDLSPIETNTVDYGFPISPSGYNTDYLIDFSIYHDTNGMAKSYYFYLNNFRDDYYYDFYIFANQDREINYTSDNNITYTFSRSNQTLNSVINNARDFDLSNMYDTDYTISLINPYHFYGVPNDDEGFFRFRYPNALYLNQFHIYIYITQKNVNNVNNYFLNNLDDNNINNFYNRENGVYDYINESFNYFYIELEFNAYKYIMTENFIFNYDYSYSSFIANSVKYYKNYLFSSLIHQNHLSKYGYGFFQSCFPLKDLYISGSIYDFDTDAIYPTYSQNMLYYVIPDTFPKYNKFSNDIPYSSIELLYSFDYRDYDSSDFNFFFNEQNGGLFKNYDALNYSDEIQNNFYSFGFSRMCQYSNDDIYYFNPKTPFMKIDAVAYYESDINSGSLIDNSSDNDSLANALGLHKISCKWWDLKGQLQNLFYYLITGLPFLNSLYKFLNQIFGISKIGFNLISFSVPLLSLVSFVLLVYIVFNKLLK